MSAWCLGIAKGLRTARSRLLRPAACLYSTGHSTTTLQEEFMDSEQVTTPSAPKGENYIATLKAVEEYYVNGVAPVAPNVKQSSKIALDGAWNNGQVGPRGHTFLQNGQWAKLWVDKDCHDTLKSIANNYHEYLPRLTAEIVSDVRAAFKYRLLAVKLLSAIFQEVGNQSHHTITTILRPIAPYAQLAPPGLWSLDYMDSHPLTVNEACVLVEILSHQPRGPKVNLLNAFLKDQRPIKNLNTNRKGLLAVAASGAHMPVYDSETLFSLISQEKGNNAAEGMCLLSWVAANNQQEQLVQRCCAFVKQACSYDVPIVDAGDAMRLYCMGKEQKLWRHPEIVTVLTNNGLFGSYHDAGLFLGQAAESFPCPRDAYLSGLATLGLSCAPSDMVSFLSAFLAFVEDSDRINQAKKLEYLSGIHNVFGDGKLLDYGTSSMQGSRKAKKRPRHS